MRQVQDSDLGYLWAAYRLGMWDDYLPPVLSQSMFEARIIEMIAHADYDWIIEAKSDDGVRPVGLVLAQAMLDGRRIEPHVDWFPWATPRNRFEGVAAYLREVGKRFKIVLYVPESDQAFWERVKMYRLLRHGCKVIDHFDRGEHAYLFYTVGM